MKNTLTLVIAGLAAAWSAVAQPTFSTPPTNSPIPTFNWNGITLPLILNQPITVNGQTIIVETNQSGGMTVITYGVYGTNAFTPPTTTAGAVSTAQGWVSQNNPANIGYYSTNGEWDFKLGAVYSQNTGQAGALIDIGRYGVITSMPNIGADVGIIEGSQGGQNGTAAGFLFADYRHPIGDVCPYGGLGGGYDVLTGKPMGLVKAGVEYRQNKNLGEFVSVVYDVEGFNKTKLSTGGTINDPSGLQITGGLTVNF